jgi:acetyltransferase-like isoleucine patch superfamily enzyme
MLTALAEARRKLERDRRERGLSWATVLRKSARYALELCTAKLWLRAATQVGSGVRTLRRPRIDNQGTLRIGAGTLLRSINVPVELAVGPKALLEIGEGCRLNYGVSIGAMGEIRIGNRVRLGPYVMVIDTEFHDAYDREKMPAPRPVIIEDDVFVGAKASIMPGVTIGRGAIVGTASVVSSDVPPFTMVLGVPARTVRKLDPAQFTVAG